MKTTMKLFSLTLALILAFTCTACANDSTTPSVNLEIPSPAPSTAPAAPVEPEATEPAAPAEPEVTEPAAPVEPEVTEPAAPVEPEVTEPAAPVEPEATEPIPVVNEFVNTENYAYDVNTLSIKPRHVYWMDGKLVAECFVINGYSHTIHDIYIKHLSFANHTSTIASGSFGSLNGLTLAPYQYVVWTFTFSADCVNAANTDLSYLTATASASYWY